MANSRAARYPMAALVLVACGSSAGHAPDAGHQEEPSIDGSAADRAGQAPGPGPADTAPAVDGPGSSTPAPPDARAADAGPLFAGCPSPEAYVGNPAWKDAVVIKPGMKLCARFVESDGTLDKTSTVNQLKTSLARKAVATIAAGTYKLPDAQGKAPYALPVCFVPVSGKPLATGTGTVERGMYGGGHTFWISLPLPAMGLLRANLFWQSASPFAIDGIDAIDRCPDELCTAGLGDYLVECELPAPPRLDVVTFENGSVELAVTIYRGGIGAGTEPGVFNRASGSFRGVSFDQRDYFKLVYSPEHHHFTRNYAVLFDAPIAGACGLEIVNVPGPPTTRAVHVFAVDCALGRQSEVKVTAVKAEVR